MKKKRTTAETTKQKYGDDYYYNLGKKGGSAKYKGKKGFAAATREQRQEWGRKGGMKSSRKKLEE